MRRESDIKRDYRPTWSLWEGVREVVQNAWDAKTEHRATFSVTHDGRRLLVKNEGCTLDREAMLFGHSTKAGRSDLIGQYGDGFKVGMLALVRSGHPVVVWTGGEKWVPAIERSRDFKADVLTWRISEGLAYQHRVLVEIQCTRAEWSALEKRFLFLGKPHPDTIKTDYGWLLGDPDHDGKLFVKGIYVQEDKELQNGYNLTANVEVDIDRKMVDSWHAKWSIGRIQALAAHSPKAVDRVLAMIEDESKDVAGLKDLSPGDIPAQLADQAAARFLDTFGPTAIPVASLEESAKLAHAGRIGVVVGAVKRAVLAVRLDTFDKVKDSLDVKVAKKYSWDELTDGERKNFEQARDLIKSAGIEYSGVWQVVDFRDGDCLGLHTRGVVYLRRDQLATRKDALETMVHEVAHAVGGADGEITHVRNIEDIWSRIVEYLRG